MKTTLTDLTLPSSPWTEQKGKVKVLQGRIQMRGVGGNFPLLVVPPTPSWDLEVFFIHILLFCTCIYIYFYVPFLLLLFFTCNPLRGYTKRRV